MIRLAIEEIQAVRGYRIGAIVETVLIGPTGRLCHAWIAKRPLAIVIVPGEAVGGDRRAIAFTPQGDVLSLDAIDKLRAGALDEVMRRRSA